jgi:hypothetical protein
VAGYLLPLPESFPDGCPEHIYSRSLPLMMRVMWVGGYQRGVQPTSAPFTVQLR